MSIVKKVSDEIVDTLTRKTDFRGHEVPKNLIGLGVFFVILLLMMMVFAEAANQETIDLGGKGEGYGLEKTLPLMTGHSDENSPTTVPIKVFEPNVVGMEVTLRWADEDDEFGMENEPDEFRLEIDGPWGNGTDSGGYTTNSQGGEGKIELELENPSEEEFNLLGTGIYNITIDCGDCGEQWPLGIPSAGLSDDGNDWSLEVTYEYSVQGGNAIENIIIPGESSQEVEQSVDVKVVDQNLISINFTLTWKDEADQVGRTNEPDEFAIKVTTPWDETQETARESNTHGQEGSVSLGFIVPSETIENEVGTGNYEVIVDCGDCGDQTPTVDDGNTWILSIEYIYNVEFEPEEIPPPTQ